MTIQLNEDQSKALKNILDFLNDDSVDAFILRGGAGTGKTTLIGKLVEELRDRNFSFGLVSPTGRAARILGNKVMQVTGQFAESKTIHSLIYTMETLEVYEKAQDKNDPGMRMHFGLKDAEPDMSLIIIDESSMVGDHETYGDVLRFGSGRLLQDVISFSRVKRTNRKDVRRTKILFVGDPAQLPPVGENISPALSADYLASEYNLSSSEFDLKLVMRQAKESEILKRANEVREAILTQRFNSFSLSATGNDVREVNSREALELVEQNIKAKASTVVVVSSNAAALEYNKSIRARLWGSEGLPIQSRDTLLVNRNAYLHGLTNGDLVKVLQVDPEPETVWVRIKGSEPVELRFRSAEVALREADGSVRKLRCNLLENLLDSPSRELSAVEQRALLVHFRNRHPNLSAQSSEFRQLISSDPYFNAVQVKYGYALTCHKAQGGEWDAVVVDFSQSGGVRNAAFFRWAYTAITRAAKELILVNPPDFSEIASDMWESRNSSGAIPSRSKADNSEKDYDWHRLSFSESIAPLFLIHQKLRSRWEAQGITIQRLDHLQYCERYTLARDQSHAVVQYYYNGKNKVGRFGLSPGHDSEAKLGDDALSAFSEIREEVNPVQPEHFIVEFLETLDAALKDSDIRRTSFRALPYRLRVIFSDSHRKGKIDFTYDGKFTWTKAQEVGGVGTSGGLFEDVQRLMTMGES